jgi:hypothetical protein
MWAAEAGRGPRWMGTNSILQEQKDGSIATPYEARSYLQCSSCAELAFSSLHVLLASRPSRSFNPPVLRAFSFSSIAPSLVGGPCAAPARVSPCPAHLGRLLGYLSPLWPARPLLLSPRTSLGRSLKRPARPAIQHCHYRPCQCVSLKRHSSTSRARRAHFKPGIASPLHLPAGNSRLWIFQANPV